MPFLEIAHYTGEVDRRELRKQVPVSIGSHATNDIRIDEDDVEILHCRISWNKTAYEAVAAGVSPLDVNGTPMQRSLLNDGDVLRFGSVDIRYRESEDDGGSRKSEAQQSSPSLKPTTEELILSQTPIVKSPGAPKGAPPPRKQSERETKKQSAAASSKRTRPEAPPTEALLEAQPLPASFGDALEALARESLIDVPAQAGSKRRDVEAKQAKAAEPPSQNEAPPQPAETPAASAAKSARDRRDGMSETLRTALRSQQRRPGEEDPLRSPLVLGLSGAAAVLLLAGAIFYLVGHQQTTEKSFAAAKQYYDQGNYRSAIEALDLFVVNNSKHPLAQEATRLLGLARVRQHVEGSAARFEQGLNQLKIFVEENRDRKDFSQLHPEIVELAKTISLNSALAAGKQLDLKLLEISRDARTILKTYSPKDAPPTETLEQIEQAQRASEAAIRRDDVYKELLAAIDEALTDNSPLNALKRRRDLLVRYPEFERDRQVQDRLQQILSAEQRKVLARDVDQPALTEDHQWPTDTLTLAFQGRTRTDEVAVGKAVVALAQDCCYGLEFATGELLWRRVVGFDLPFFPLLEDDLPSLILFDTEHQELIRLRQLTGQLVWRQPLKEEVSGRPLLTSDALYVATKSGKLLSVDLASGRITGSLQFSQSVSGPVGLDDPQRMAVVGNDEVVYTLTKRPFACQSVLNLGQAAGSVEAPLLAVASYLLVIENGANQATLHLLATGKGEAPLTSIANSPIAGRVVDTPVVRGRDLFVPSVGVRVSAFSLSNDPGQPVLTGGPVYQGEGQHQGPVYLMTGPDRQLWMATGALARLRLTTDALQQDSNPVAQGRATQPLQFISGYLFHARRRPFTTGVTFTRTDRDELTSDWQAVLGSKIIAWDSREGGTANIVAINDAGHAFRIGDRQLEGRFQSDAAYRLPLHQDLVDPLLATSLSNDRLAVACGGPEPRIWIINAAGQVEASPQLPSAPQAPPAMVGSEVVVPLAGRIHVVRQSNRSPVQDFALPSGEEQHWISVSPIGGQQAAGLTAQGQIILLRLNESPRPHLGEVARLPLGQQVVQPAAAGNGLLAVVDRSQRVSLFEGERLEPRGTRTFPSGLTNRPFIAAGKLFVEEGGQQFHCLETGGDLPTLWSVETHGSSVAGLIEHHGELVVALQSGLVLFVEPASGNVSRKVETQSPLSIGPLATPAGLFVGAIDGTLIRVSEK